MSSGWEATWTARDGNGWDPADPSSGNGWEKQALFDHDDRALPAMEWFGHRGGGPRAPFRRSTALPRKGVDSGQAARSTGHEHPGRGTVGGRRRRGSPARR
ncbi:hypothetical protein GCM10010267_14270 [Streptomyces griseorubens]|nr:hypothetical protein GCM10010267_14270 [Streptomyces griseorubens]